MKNVLTVLFVLLLSGLAQAQWPSFTTDVQIRGESSTSRNDTLMIETTSLVYSNNHEKGRENMQIFYKFTDTGTINTKLYFEAVVQGQLKDPVYVKLDSVTVNTIVSFWRVWDIGGAHTERWRLRKDVNTDTLMAIYKGVQ